eukprot:TRINITY_DN9651_c0_g1_i1.p4 TRINITY_DN9651_c0_g1~~TRINITY_DN9651_c0_g1_i1.p4  ORF type:complete len:159 (-),score=57.65 TRINITY_DN9651_c0_g1_i1:357-833(-)
MTHKAAAFIVDALESCSGPYSIQHLEFAGTDLGELGVRRVCELLCANPHLKFVALGSVSDPALKIIAESMPNFVGVQTLCFECPQEKKWSKESINAFTTAFKHNEILMEIKIEEDNAKGFTKELKFYAQQNRKKAELNKYLDETQKTPSTEKIFASVT